MKNSQDKSLQAARGAGVLVGMACGDALGAAYEFGGPIARDREIGMVGGGAFKWEPGEWTDDTDMAIPIAEILSEGHEITDPEQLDWLVDTWKYWAARSKDVGSQTSSVLRGTDFSGERPAVYAKRRADEVWEVIAKRGATGGTGALMRTSPLALGYLDRPEGELAQAARIVAGLTHGGEYSASACVLWCIAIRHAVLTGELDIRRGLKFLPERDMKRWEEYILAAERGVPSDFHRDNGQVLGAFQGAWCAINGSVSFETAVEDAVRGGGDTDTVAAIAGGLAGAFYGVAQMPSKWRRALHGFSVVRPMRYRDLVNLAMLSMRRGMSDGVNGWPEADYFKPGFERTLVQHPHDDGVWMGSLAAVDMKPEVDVVISMSRVGTEQYEGRGELIEFWLVDYPGENINTAYVLADAADAVAEARGHGKTVLIHCYAAHSRTPSTAAAYSVRHLGVSADKAIKEVCAALPEAMPQSFLSAAVRKLAKDMKPVLQ
jgi:ADP-ribosylglycohydrolase